MDHRGQRLDELEGTVFSHAHGWARSAGVSHSATAAHSTISRRRPTSPPSPRQARRGRIGRPAQLFVLGGGEPALVELGIVGASDAHCRIEVLQTTPTFRQWDSRTRKRELVRERLYGGRVCADVGGCGIVPTSATSSLSCQPSDPLRENVDTLSEIS